MKEGPFENRKIRVLHLEDDERDAEFVLRELRRAGFDPVHSRVDSESAFLAHLHSDIDVILSDYTMPGFDAPTALRLLGESGYEIPFIVVSGTVGEEIAAAVVRAGADDYLLKDRLTRLGPAITHSLDKTRLRREHKRSEAAIKASQERFSELAEHIREVFWTRDPESNQIVYVSPGYQLIWGRSCESLYASPGDWMEAIHPDDRDRISEAVRTKQPRGEYDEEYRVVRPDGSARWIHDRAFPIRDAAGRVYRIVGVADDITERRELEEQFRHAQKMEAVGHLAGGVAHDFNNLLTVIRGYAQMLLTGDQSESEKSAGAFEILAAAERAAGLTRQLLMFSRKQAVQLKALDVNQVVAGLAKMLQRVIGEDISLRLKCQPGLPPARADAGMLEQVLMNLSVNSRDAMPEGGELTVSTCLTRLDEGYLSAHPKGRSGDFIAIELSDTGTGMPPEVMARIFEPFFTTKSPGKGTGLGLATVFSIVEQHQGWIEVKSELNQGTRFRLFLPRDYDECESSPVKHVAIEVSGGTETILCVEDDAVIRQLITTILERRNYRVLKAGSGLEAMAVWKEHAQSIDLVITDMIMPDGMTGGQLVEMLLEQKPGLKVIFASGYFADSRPAGLVLQEGVNFLQKPFSPDQLAEIVRNRFDA